MENISYTIDEKETKKAIKKLERKIRQRKFKQTMSNVGRWIVDNKELVLILGPAVIGLVGTGIGLIKTGIQTHGRLKAVKIEEKVKEHRCYDRSLGQYWTLSRKLTNRELKDLDSRKRQGERMADILSDFNVLK